MIKLSEKTSKNTSFYGVTIKTTVEDLINKIGEPQDAHNDGSNKVNFDWCYENEDGNVFTIYDWKEYRPISKTEIIEFHIGGRSWNETVLAKEEILSL